MTTLFLIFFPSCLAIAMIAIFFAYPLSQISSIWFGNLKVLIAYFVVAVLAIGYQFFRLGDLGG